MKKCNNCGTPMEDDQVFCNNCNWSYSPIPTKKCKYCREEIDKKAKICSHCRKPQGSPILRIIIGVIIGLALIIFFANNIDYYYFPITYIPVTSNRERDNFSYIITDSKRDNSNIAYYIEGIVTNNTSNSYSYVQIQFVCYDKNGINLGTVMANTNNISSYEKWKFNATGIFDDAKSIDHCDFKEVTGF